MNNQDWQRLKYKFGGRRPLKKNTRGAAVLAAKRRYSAPARRNVATKRRALAQIANMRTAGFLGIETKFYDTYRAPVAVVSPTDCSGGEYDPSATSMISTPAQGDGETNRDGKRIVIKSVQIKGQITTSAVELAAGPYVGCKVFIALVRDTQSNAAQLNSEDVFKNWSGDATLAACPLRNLLYAERFEVLKTELLDLTPNALSHVAADAFSYPGGSATFEWFKTLELPVNFNAGTTATIANVVDNSLHVIAFTSSTQSTPLISYNSRIRFQG